MLRSKSQFDGSPQAKFAGEVGIRRPAYGQVDVGFPCERDLISQRSKRIIEFLGEVLLSRLTQCARQSESEWPVDVGQGGTDAARIVNGEVQLQSNLNIADQQQRAYSTGPFNQV